jgi:hypothetical protein
METIAPTIIFRMGHSFVLLNGRTAVSVPDNLALALWRRLTNERDFPYPRAGDARTASKCQD